MAEGARVVVLGRCQERLEEAVASVGNGAVGVRGDTRESADLDRLYDTIAGFADRIDVLVANAGSPSSARLGEITEAMIDEAVDVNLRGTVLTAQKALPFLGAGSSVVLTASVARKQGIPGFDLYSASKAAVRSLARSWAVELKDRGVRVNAISPGPIETPGVMDYAQDEDEAARLRATFAAQVPLDRMGQPDEVAAAMLFLASEESSFVTGSELVVDGGLLQV